MRALGLSLVLAWALALGAPAVAVAGEDDYADAQLLSIDEQGEVRGGLQILGGFDVGFGAVVRTYVDGSLALQTRLTWTETGPVEALEVGTLTPNLAAAAATGGLVFQGGGSEQLQGLLLPGDGGVTAIAHSLTSANITQLVINNANNRDIRQATEITLKIPEMAALQQDIGFQAFSMNLQAAVGAALLDAASH
jgi:hypothetical protein